MRWAVMLPPAFGITRSTLVSSCRRDLFFNATYLSITKLFTYNWSWTSQSTAAAQSFISSLVLHKSSAPVAFAKKHFSIRPIHLLSSSRYQRIYHVYHDTLQWYHALCELVTRSQDKSKRSSQSLVFRCPCSFHNITGCLCNWRLLKQQNQRHRRLLRWKSSRRCLWEANHQSSRQ